ncbi:MAG: hypothetical protein K6A44_06920 [bacterium]|nr:hypothetical protein [bacterium]
MDIVRSLFHYESKAMLYSGYSMRVTKYTPPKYAEPIETTVGWKNGAKCNQASGNELADYLGKL